MLYFKSLVRMQGSRANTYAAKVLQKCVLETVMTLSKYCHKCLQTVISDLKLRQMSKVQSVIMTVSETVVKGCSKSRIDSGDFCLISLRFTFWMTKQLHGTDDIVLSTQLSCTF